MRGTIQGTSSILSVINLVAIDSANTSERHHCHYLLPSVASAGST